ncbi:MAG: winged helix-turn-helix domain-containing protein [Candidatus Oleimicrobiaceae bacterium]
MSESAALQQSHDNEPLGLAAFDSLRAEDEPWLERCYVPPVDFELMARWRSVLVFGDSGAGKTALRLALQRRWTAPADGPRPLVAYWPFSLQEDPSLTGIHLVRAYCDQALDVVARTLAHRLVECPPDWGQIPSWAQDTLAWFLRRFLRGQISQYIDSLACESPVERISGVKAWLAESAVDVLPPGSPMPLVIAELVKALQPLGIDGIRVAIDGLEPWYESDRALLADHLASFMSALALFEHPRFAYAIMVPGELDSRDWSPGSVVRRRVDVYRLQWDTEALVQIMERRLALALGEGDLPLSKLGPPDRLRQWLAGCGGHNPRGWLATLRPFVNRFAAKSAKTGQRKPLTDEECVKVQDESPPRLHVEPSTGRIFVGWREITGLQPAQITLLKYLYSQRGEPCARKVVLRVYLEATDQLFRLDEPNSERLLDQPIYRLRQAIEPDPYHPVFILTERGGTIRLRNAW